MGWRGTKDLVNRDGAATATPRGRSGDPEGRNGAGVTENGGGA